MYKLQVDIFRDLLQFTKKKSFFAVTSLSLCLNRHRHLPVKSFVMDLGQ